MSSEDEGGRIVFANPKRSLADEEKTSLISVGVDIGSSTTHLAFSRIRMEQRDFAYVVAERVLLFESDIFLTPYTGDNTIDADALRRFVAEQYSWAGLTSDQVDTGALILTGVAVRRKNARSIGELFAVETGKFVSVSAGDRLEAAMAAYGSGAILNSDQANVTVLNIDIGGGTTKFAICDLGKIVDLTAVDIGARIIVLDKEGKLTRIEEAGKIFASECEVTLTIGEVPPLGSLERISERMAEYIAEIAAIGPLSKETRNLLRLPAMNWSGNIDCVTFSGGVSEYVYGYEKKEFGDLGPLLALAIRQRMEGAGVLIMESVESIRATVVGASQYSIQLSGTTIFVHPENILPLRNIPVVAPNLPLTHECFDKRIIAQSIEKALIKFDQEINSGPLAICFDWMGPASFARIDAFLKGVLLGLSTIVAAGHPVVLVCKGDIGRVFGLHLSDELDAAVPIVSIDSITLSEFDFIDIGAPLTGSAAVPVVIKSLLFPNSVGLGTKSL